ncbi:hypothetical protein NP233_g6789 [Leucocoprinus birnbaumii]|uniref:FH2 domain-containing protein n=1 Tax=Leucocoprinus birnbaumii TaxID=56174 RepID=A0AAD5VVZ4_9AGAR|nr:hypothetical protein NP233_g6789 [Leucocoprinus birnbaumii]
MFITYATVLLVPPPIERAKQILSWTTSPHGKKMPTSIVQLIDLLHIVLYNYNVIWRANIHKRRKHGAYRQYYEPLYPPRPRPPPPPPPPPTNGSLVPGAPAPPPPPPSFTPGFKPLKVRSKPAKKLKPFFWNKLNNTNISNTVWNDFSAAIDVDMGDLEATFTVDNMPATPSKISVASAKKDVTTLLDINRANHVAIMLSRIKLEFPQIRKALLNVDDSKLSVDNLRAISKQLPTMEEVERIRSFGDVSKLSKADQYFSEIMTIPRLAERLECMLFRRKLELDIEEVRPELNILRNASREVRSSVRFKKLLQVVLTLGNALNGSTFRGGALGFQMEGLLKLKETKTARGGPSCPTLLHYLARVLLRSDPSLATFIDEMPNLEAAARTAVQPLLQSVNQLSSGLSRVKLEVDNLKEFGPLDGEDHFVQVMEPFVDKVKESIQALASMGTTLDKELKSLLTYYGEDPSSPEAPKPEDFFGLIASFSSSLQKCMLEMHDAQAKEAPAVPKIIHEPAPSDEKTETTLKGNKFSTNHGLQPPPIPPTPTQAIPSGKSVGRGDLDQAIRSMRHGKRRERPARPLSKIFFDGTNTISRPQSRFFADTNVYP